MPGADRVEIFLLLFVRCLAFFGIGPLFGDRKIPPQVKALAAAATAVALFPTIDPARWVFASTLPGLVFYMVGEILLGAALGLTASFVFIGVRMSGNLLGIQMGLSIVNVFDPNTSSEVSLVGEIQELLAIFLFLLVDGHHLFFRALAFSLDQAPPGSPVDPARLAAALVPAAGGIFLATIQVGAPVLAALFLTDAALGFVARAVPQMNVFIVGIPVKIAVGIVLLVVTAPLFARLLTTWFSGLEGRLLTILAGM